MNAELKAKWVEALRSGRYSQTRGALRDEDGYCCLGVLCDVQGRKWERRSGGGYLFASLVTPPEIISAGLDAAVAHRLAEMNDGDEDGGRGGAAFNEIADYIEANIPSEPQQHPSGERK